MYSIFLIVCFKKKQNKIVIPISLVFKITLISKFKKFKKH